MAAANETGRYPWRAFDLRRLKMKTVFHWSRKERRQSC
jgi:hypothetical protein